MYVMKKFILLFSLILICLTVNAQRHKILAEVIAKQIVEETNGYIASQESEEDVTAIWIGVPSFYDFDLVRTAIKNVIDKFNDMEVKTPWTALDDVFVTMVKAGTYEGKCMIIWDEETIGLMLED